VVAQAPEVEVVETPAAAAAQPEPAPPVRRPAVPRWLAASFVVIPAIAVMYALFFPNGVECGVGAQLGIDPVTGEAENCDGSPYGSNQVDFFSAGEELYARNCAACHGPNGEGGGNFPVLTGGAVAATFPACSDHLQWVGLGSLGWPDAAYGANATPVGSSGAQMPAFGSVLTPEELAAVVLYERVAFGGLSVADAEADCVAETPAAPAG
jgi:mono/diheme cytochrome c family protein